jgi:hypothetical protein
LPAKAIFHPTLTVTDTPLSLASQLLQGRSPSNKKPRLCARERGFFNSGGKAIKFAVNH